MPFYTALDSCDADRRLLTLAVQFIMMPYWLALPVLLVIIERSIRTVMCFYTHPARLEALDDGTVVITAEKPEGSHWRAHAGQYVRTCPLTLDIVELPIS